MNEHQSNPLSPAEAQVALNEAARQKERAQRVYDTFNGIIFIIWGAIYAVAYGIEYLRPGTNIVWLPLVLIGFLLSFWFGSQMGTFLKSNTGRAYRSLWASFGLVYFLLGWGFAVTKAPEGLFSFTINLFIAYVLVANAIATRQLVLARAGMLLATVNTLFFIFVPSRYEPAMAAVGLLAIATGLRIVKSHEV